jgi:CBS domain-containing protein
MSIREILASKNSGEIFSIAPDSNILAAITLMGQHDIGSLVVKEGGRMVGLLTDRDIVRGLCKANCNLSNTLVRDVMVASPVVGHPDDTADQVRRLMTESHISHLPVVGEEGLIGIISFYDVARTALSNVEFENKLLKRYIKDWPEEQG